MAKTSRARKKRVTKMTQIRAYVAAHPNAKAAKVAERFAASESMVYKAKREQRFAVKYVKPARQKANHSDSSQAASSKPVTVFREPSRDEQLINDMVTVKRIGIERVAKILEIFREL